MATKRAIPWFLTETGRKFSFAAVTGVSIAITTVKFAPHTFFIDYYKDFVRYYSNGKPVDLPAELRLRYQKCLEILQVPDVHKKLISPFSVFGYDLFHAGSTSSKFGAAVGIPVNFTYKSISDIEKDDIQVNHKKVDLSSENGKKLANALLLPEKLQQFAICREIMMTQNNKVFYESTYPFICVFFAYNLSSYLNKRLNLYVAPSMLRGTLYSIVGLFSLGSYFLMKDMTEVYYETDTDKKLCEISPEFIESGVEFYDKIIQRNQVLFELMGSEGARKYTKLGNENYFIRQPRVALSHRKQYFESKLKGQQSENNDTDKNDTV